MAAYGRALIVGATTTVGKGPVQVPRNIADFLPMATASDSAGMLKSTAQKFRRVGGASKKRKGVVRDIVLPTASACLDIGEAKLDYPLP